MEMGSSCYSPEGFIAVGTVKCRTFSGSLFNMDVYSLAKSFRNSESSSCSAGKFNVMDFDCTPRGGSIAESFASMRNALLQGEKDTKSSDSNPNPNPNLQDVSRIQLKVMQTRKFARSPNLVVKAIAELNKDKGNICTEVVIPNYTCAGALKQTKTGDTYTQQCVASDGRSVLGFTKQDVKSDGYCTDIKGLKTVYEIETNFPANTETILRIRMSNSKNPQFTDPQVYGLHFKEIADGLFIDAIELTPAEIQ